MNMSSIPYILLPLQKLAKIKVSTPISHMIMSTYDRVFLHYTYSTLAINCIQCFSQTRHIVLPFKLDLNLLLFSKSSLLYKGFFRAFIFLQKWIIKGLYRWCIGNYLRWYGCEHIGWWMISYRLETFGFEPDVCLSDRVCSWYRYKMLFCELGR